VRCWWFCPLCTAARLDLTPKLACSSSQEEPPRLIGTGSSSLHHDHEGLMANDIVTNECPPLSQRPFTPRHAFTSLPQPIHYLRCRLEGSRPLRELDVRGRLGGGQGGLPPVLGPVHECMSANVRQLVTGDIALEAGNQASNWKQSKTRGRWPTQSP
jgi:hypothetical protein